MKRPKIRRAQVRRDRAPLERGDRVGLGDVLTDLKAIGAEGTTRELAFVLGVTELSVKAWGWGRRRPLVRYRVALAALRRLRQVLPNVGAP